MDSTYFYKYQATGNDFVLFDDRNGILSFSQDQIMRICHRKWGIGADGLIVIGKSLHADFDMIYYNSDGTQSLCGNGCRAAASLAFHLNMVNNHTVFSAFDGIHEASLSGEGMVRLKMHDVHKAKHIGSDIFFDTGSPHYIRFVTHLDAIDVVQEGKKIRQDKAFAPHGVNANFVELLSDNVLSVRTYERGVEQETLSCGTGAVASALAASLQGYSTPVTVRTKGGDLFVEFKPDQKGAFSYIFLSGPVKMVFQGSILL